MITKLFDRRSSPELEKPHPPRDTAEINLELAYSRDALATLSEQAQTAAAELNGVRLAYDAGMESFALGEVSREPERATLAAATARFDALNRSRGNKQREVTALASELAAATLTQAIDMGRRRIPELTAAAEEKLGQLERALQQAKESEKVLFDLLYDDTEGLKQVFPSEELAAEARKVRLSIAKRLETFARKLGYIYSINPRFETDGLPNLGVERLGMLPWR